MRTAARAELGKFQPLGIILFVLGRRISTFFAISARKLDNYSVFTFFSHRISNFPLNFSRSYAKILEWIHRLQEILVSLFNSAGFAVRLRRKASFAGAPKGRSSERRQRRLKARTISDNFYR
jgi:hypothetical protein